MVLGGQDNVLLANNPDAGSGSLKHPCDEQVSVETFKMNNGLLQ